LKFLTAATSRQWRLQSSTTPPGQTSYAEIDKRVLATFPQMTIADLAAAYREAALQDYAEADQLEAFLHWRDGV